MSNRGKTKGRRESGSFLAIPHTILKSDNYKQLTPAAVKLLLDIAGQFKGANNGDLCAAPSVMKPLGWRSPSTLHDKEEELQHYGFIVKTRQGGRHKASLFAISWRPIDECKGKLDVKESRVAGNEWKVKAAKWIPKRVRKNSLADTKVVSITSDCYENRTNGGSGGDQLVRESYQSRGISLDPCYENRTPSKNYTNGYSSAVFKLFVSNPAVWRIAANRVDAINQHQI